MYQRLLTETMLVTMENTDPLLSLNMGPSHRHIRNDATEF